MTTQRTVAQLGEFGLIRDLARLSLGRVGVKTGIGDDTAVLAGPSAGKNLLFTTDMLVEGVHFTSGTSASDVGHKALACSLSDIAAMGGAATYAVVSLGLPADCPAAYPRGIYQAMLRLARKFSVAVVGGDTVRSDKVVINVALLGEARRPVRRGGARPGDVIFVSGPLGQSFKSGRHLRFTPRLAEAAYLMRYFPPAAMIDISDGLAADLGHICAQSGTGAVIEEAALPLNPGAGWQNAFYDGEDFELLFCLRPEPARRLSRRQGGRFRFFAVGEITDRKGQLVLLDRQGRRQRVAIKGYTHFS